MLKIESRNETLTDGRTDGQTDGQTLERNFFFEGITSFLSGGV